MSKLLKFLKPYAGAVLAILCVLIVQAYCDLSLPTYTSEIVNVGIQQGGIDETVPDTISEEDLDHLLVPDSSASSASGGLFIRDHQRSVRCSFFCHSFGTDIGGIKCIKISHFTARPVRVKSAFYFFHRNNIRTS